MAIETKEQPTSTPLTPGGVMPPLKAALPSSPGYYTRLIIDLPPEGARALNKLLDQTGGDVTDLFQRALALYAISKEAVQDGKVVGIAEREECLETQFIGF